MSLICSSAVSCLILNNSRTRATSRSHASARYSAISARVRGFLTVHMKVTTCFSCISLSGSLATICFTQYRSTDSYLQSLAISMPCISISLKSFAPSGITATLTTVSGACFMNKSRALRTNLPALPSLSGHKTTLAPIGLMTSFICSM